MTRLAPVPMTSQSHNDMCDDVTIHVTADVATPVVDTDDAFGAADPNRGTRAGSYSASRLSMATPPTAGESTKTATPAATNLAAPSPPDMTRVTADGATATAASATDTGVDVDTDPNPAATGLPAAEHISSFLLRIRWCADDMAAGPVLGAAPLDTGADVAVGTPPRAKAHTPRTAHGLLDCGSENHRGDLARGHMPPVPVLRSLAPCGAAN